MKNPAHFKASIHYLPAEDGGLTTPISTGFRTVLRFPFDPAEYFGELMLPDEEIIFAGDTVSAEIRLRSYNGEFKLYEGMDFDLIINEITVATGIVTKVY